MADQIVPSGEALPSATSGLIAGLRAPASTKAVLLACSSSKAAQLRSLFLMDGL